MAIKSVYSFSFLLNTEMCTGMGDYFFSHNITHFFFAPVATIDDLKNLRLPKLYIVSYTCNIPPVKTDKEFINTTVQHKTNV